MEKPVVSVVMGSDSDLSAVKDAVDILKEFGISYEILILSAHRSPEATHQYAKFASSRGIKVIIAAAGGSAHLAGVIASYSLVPVIGIPIKSSTLNGIDSLYSIVQMPPGIPVATVGINASKNAGILAIEILSLDNKMLQKKLKEYKKQLAKTVAQKNKKLTELGIAKYLQLLNK